MDKKKGKVWIGGFSLEQEIFLVSAMCGFFFLFMFGVVALFNYLGFMQEMCLELTLKCVWDWISKFILSWGVVMAAFAFALNMVLPLIKRWENKR